MIYAHGPGGSGKTALLRAMRRRAGEAGRRSCWLSDPTAGTTFAWSSDGLVVFVDKLDRFESTGSLRDILCTFPANAVVVVASRHPPGVEWRRDGWEHVLTEVKLAPLSQDYSLTLLRRLGVPAAAADAIQRWAAGLPLTLVLAATMSVARGAVARESEIATKVAAVVTDGEQDLRFQDALHVCVIARTTTAELLSSVLGTDSDSAFDWLAGRSYIESNDDLLTVHELVRPSLCTAMATAAPERDQQLRRRLCDHYYRDAVAGSRTALADLAHLVSSPRVQWGYRLSANACYSATSVREGDAAIVGARLSGHGFRDWWGLSRGYYHYSGANVVVARGGDGAPAGHAIGFVPATAPRELLAGDPIGAGCAAYAQQIGAASTTLVWRDTIILPGGTQGAADAGLYSLLNFSLVQRAEIPRLRHALILAFDRSERVREFCQEIGGRAVPGLRWVVDGRTLGCYHIDLGIGGLLSAQRDVVYRELHVPPPSLTTTAADVRRALDAFGSDDALSSSPLAIGPAGPGRAESVRAQLRAAAEAALAGSPHATQLTTIVDRRFLLGRDAHDTIARSLVVSRATYFRRLTEAVDRIAAHLLAQDG
ncbi:hypothetical protein [Streptomyces sp. SID13031]|uniref:hypothetical protein n=1 Tax=Streptomyces sp. SID13031 TaxID=2706046 RepID=UPI0013CA7654|nr:hypothetical protein [Streptomyces sp. SID13031]NEA37346.1 hypothetical protein [Streptomyces sp. SID13031]